MSRRRGGAAFVAPAEQEEVVSGVRGVEALVGPQTGTLKAVLGEIFLVEGEAGREGQPPPQSGCPGKTGYAAAPTCSGVFACSGPGPRGGRVDQGPPSVRGPQELWSVNSAPPPILICSAFADVEVVARRQLDLVPPVRLTAEPDRIIAHVAVVAGPVEVGAVLFKVVQVDRGQPVIEEDLRRGDVVLASRGRTWARGWCPSWGAIGAHISDVVGYVVSVSGLGAP